MSDKHKELLDAIATARRERDEAAVRLAETCRAEFADDERFDRDLLPVYESARSRLASLERQLAEMGGGE